MINDVSRAFFEADAKRNVRVEPPEEERGMKDEVVLPMKSVYGTRDAATGPQLEIRKVMGRMGSIPVDTM